MKSSKTVKSIKKNKTAKIIKPSSKMVAKTTPIMSVEDMIALITEAIQFKFKSDKTAPGLTISRLKNGDTYASVVRFNAPFGKEKRVEYKSRNNNLILALYDIARQIVNEEIVENPIDQLSNYLNSRYMDNKVISATDPSFQELVEEYRHSV